MRYRVTRTFQTTDEIETEAPVDTEKLDPAWTEQVDWPGIAFECVDWELLVLARPKAGR
jgi:hypothetical protein